jgi:predicted phage replisome organizer
LAEVKWIKITTTMFDDEKIRVIEGMPEADAILVIWIKLLTLAGKNNSNGFIFLAENIPYTDETLSTIFNRPLNTVRLALQVFKQFKMIEFDENGYLQLSNWGKHQNLEGLDKIREQTRMRVAKHREIKKMLPPIKDNATVTLRNATELELELDKNKNKNKHPPKDLLSPGGSGWENKPYKVGSEMFDYFWAAYPRKKSKGDAVKAWNKLKIDNLLYTLIINKLEDAKNSRDWTKDGGQFIPYPATWLNAKGWEDEDTQVENVPDAWHEIRKFGREEE